MGNFNSIVFPKPIPSYTRSHKNLIWVPKRKNLPDTCFPVTKSTSDVQIPCFFLPYDTHSENIVVYFHGNAEDLGSSEHFFEELQIQWKSHVLVVEYPGYGVYENEDIDADTIQSDAEDVYIFLTQTLNISPSRIILLGRSMGSGPACYLASTYQIGGLYLFSPYLSIQEAASAMVGSFLSIFVKDRFNNASIINQITCPTILVHGLQDGIIPFTHSVALYNLMKKNHQKHVLIRDEMTHNRWIVSDDLVAPGKEFFSKYRVLKSSGYSRAINSEAFWRYKRSRY